MSGANAADVFGGGDFDTAVYLALDGGWRDLEPAATALLESSTADPYDCYLALFALVSWGSATGYAALREAAASPDAAVWRGGSIDRLHSLDNTFAMLAAAAADSLDMATERGTGDERIAALAALVGIADQVYFEHCLSPSGLLASDVAALREPITAAIERGLDLPPGFGLVQTEELIEALALADPVAAAGYRARFGA